MNDIEDPSDGDDGESTTTYQLMALDEFIATLIHDASIPSSSAFLIQDNASILMPSASLSARANHRRLYSASNNHDHLITKEISRWESYPYEVDRPMLVAKPRKVKNGCVPQRRVKRSGLESAGQIRAEIQKKAESLPRAPRRRSSAYTDEAQKSTMQQELLAMFENADKKDREIMGRPEANKKAMRISIPKKPIRRTSETPEDLTACTQRSSAAGTKATPKPSKSLDDLLCMSSQGGGTTSSTSSRQTSRLVEDAISVDSQQSQQSQFSTASTESTLSEITSRSLDMHFTAEEQSSSYSQSLLPNCSIIMEEEEEPASLLDFVGKKRGMMSRTFSDSSARQSTPRKPVRRVSDIAAAFLVDTEYDASVFSNASEPSSTTSTITPSQPVKALFVSEETLNNHSQPQSSTQFPAIMEEEGDIESLDTISHDVKERKRTPPTSLDSVVMQSIAPKKPVRRESEIPATILDNEEG